MIDFVLPENLRIFTMTYQRPIFLTYWFAQIFVACTFVWYCIRRHSTCAPVTPNNESRVSLFHGLRLKPQNAYDSVIFILFICGIALYGFLILDNANLSHPDQSHITSGAMQGKLWMQINPDRGRFSPMILQEFIFIALFADHAWQYYSIAVLILLLLVVLCLAIIPFESLGDRLLLTAAFIFTAAFAVPAAGLIYAEINILIGLCLFMNLAYNYNQYLELKQNTNRAFLASIGMIFCAAYLIYVKEPMFLVFGCYAFVAMWCKILFLLPRQKSKDQGTLKEKVFLLGNEIAIMGLSAIYGLVYFFYIFLQTKERYGKEQSSGMLESIHLSLSEGPFVILYFATLVWRFAKLKRGSCKFDPVLDSLAISFILPYAAMIHLGLVVSYYYLPIGFMGLLLFAKTVAPISQKMGFRLGLACLCIAIIVSSLPTFFSFFRQRELYMQTRQRCVEFVDKLLSNDHSGSQPKIYFFERNRVYDSGQFVSFINYSLADQRFFILEPPKFDLSQGDVPVIPAVGVDSKLNSSDQLWAIAEATGIPPSAGDLFIALPSYGGSNINVDNLLAAKEKNKNRIFSFTSKISQFKEFIYDRFDPSGDTKYRAYILVF
jgi:hypothetical protein